MTKGIRTHTCNRCVANILFFKFSILFLLVSVYCLVSRGLFVKSYYYIYLFLV